VVPAGEFFGLLGPNGAGKTTLISAVCNLIHLTSGEALVFGHPHDSIQARRLVGLAEQEVNLDRIYHGGYDGMSRAHARRRAAEMVDDLPHDALSRTACARLRRRLPGRRLCEGDGGMNP
jgi:ABC-2 type transport system ATP-binding protein